MLQVTKAVIDKAIRIAAQYGMNSSSAMDEAFSDELGFGSTDMLTREVLKELHSIGLMLHHNIKD